MKLLCIQPGANSSTSDVYNGLTRALTRQGHEVIPYLLDRRLDSMARWLNWQWKRAGKPDPRPTTEDVFYLAGTPILERALWHLPDWVCVFSGSNVHPNVFRMLRRMGVPTMLLLTESPYLPDIEMDMVPWATVVFTNEVTAVEDFRKVQPHTYYLPHAYNPAVHFPKEAPDDTPTHDVVFVGTGFEERIKLLSEVDWTGIDLGLYGIWNLLGSRHPLRKFVRGGIVPNEQTVDMYRKAKVGLNLYRTSMGYDRNVEHITTAESMNPRAYELAASDVFHVSDYRPEVLDTFGGAVPTFSNANELQALLLRYLHDAAAREALARRAKWRVAGETFDKRAGFVTEILEMVARDRALRIISRDGINPPAVPVGGS